MPAKLGIIAVNGAKSVKTIWTRDFDGVCLFNSASDFPVLGLTLQKSDLGRTQELFFTLILSDEKKKEFSWKKKKKRTKGRVKQQGIAPGMVLQWLACARGPSPPEPWGWQGLGHTLFTRLQGPVWGTGEESLPGRNGCNASLASV